MQHALRIKATHLRIGTPCKDKIGLLIVLLSEGLYLALSKI